MKYLILPILILLFVNCGNKKETFTYPDGSIYIGELKNGKPEGKGTLTFANGVVYTGLFKDGQPNGRGIITNKNGIKIVGDFINGILSGQGTMTHANGSVDKIIFENGKYVKVESPENIKRGEITKQNCQAVKNGMNKEQVIALLGETQSQSEFETEGFGKTELWHYQDTGFSALATGKIEACAIHFQNGKVSMKSWTKL